MVNAQEYLDQNYPKEQRKDVEELKITNKGLEGHLDLRDFVNLKVLFCQCNKITSLDLSQNTELEIINVSRNRVDASLSIFSHLSKLRRLNISSISVNKKAEESNLSELLQERGREGRREGRDQTI